MKVVIDLTSLADNFSGIERYALNIAKEILMVDRKNNYVLIFKNNIHSNFKVFEKFANITFKVIEGKNKLFFNQITLPYFLKKIKADKYLFLAFPSPIMFRSKGIINTIHDLTCFDYPKTMKLNSRIYFKHSINNAIKVSERIITVSQFSKKRIEEKYSYDKIDIVYNGISEVFINYNYQKDSCDISKKYNLPKNYIMCLCTLEPRKNIGLLIDAYIELRRERLITDKLVLVGRRGWKIDCIMEKLEDEYVKDIVITGFVDDDDLPVIYSKARFFIFPSLYEGFGIPIIEAMYMNVPVIASNTSAIPEVISTNKLLFKNNDKSELKNKICYLSNMSKEEIKCITSIGREKSKEFVWRNEAEKIVNML